ncbi:MAG: hypothetical protein JXR51_08570 [Bacteroidales bacterium]|nr:hypothetical protein [Bacteroidales bacterium]
MKKHLIEFLILSTIFFSIISCSNKNKEDSEIPVARVYGDYLYVSDLEEIIPDGVSPEDSLNRVKSYIDFWVKRQAIMKTAEMNLIEEQKDVTEELEDYRMKLLIFRYKQKFIEQNLDTVVTDSQIEQFYNENQAEFLVGQPVIKALYIKILKTTTNLEMVKRLYRSSRERDIEQLSDYCVQNATKYNDFNNEWIYFKDLLIDIPIRVDNQEEYLKSKNYIEVEDSVFSYFASIKNYRLKNSIAPLVFVQGNIQSVILNKRKQKLIDDLENNIYNNMLDNMDIELFEGTNN